MSCPKVSLCIDVYNYAGFLPAAIESVLRQTLADFELLIGDDCSTDGSFDIAQNYAAQDCRIRAWRNSVNLGMVRNRNACLRQAKGEYVKFVHADDFLYHSEALSRMAARLDSNPAASLVACAMQFVRADGSPTRIFSSPFPSRRFLAGTNVISECLREQKNLIGSPSATMFRRSCAERGFNEHYFHAADWEMWFHLLEQGCFGYTTEPMVAYRLHADQQTEKDKATLSQANDHNSLLADYLDKPYVRLRSRLKTYLRHDAVRQTVRRAAQIGQPQAGAQAIHNYGRQRYYADYGWCWLWRKAGKRLPFLQTSVFPSTASDSRDDMPLQFPPGLNVAGFLKGQYGIGESSRAFCRAAAASGLPVAQINIDSRDHRNQENAEASFGNSNPYGVNLMTFSFDYSRRFYKDRGPGFFAGRHNIALWYWEQERFPTRWHGNFDYYDEIWVPTRFCKEAFEAVSPIPVHQITYPLADVEAVPVRAEFGLAPDARVFLFNFDFFSTLARKNPLGVIAAFRQAFADDLQTRNAVLVLKSINSSHDVQGRAQVQDALVGLNAVWIEDHLTGVQMQSLFASADCYISLHRSEGLGLGMAQAMAAGKPVIATAYSGNMEYMNRDNSLLVDYERVELTDNYGPGSNPAIYEQGNVWAEPNVEQAAQHLQWVYAHPEESARLGQRARQDIRNTLNPKKTQTEILTRVQQIYAEHGKS